MKRPSLERSLLGLVGGLTAAALAWAFLPKANSVDAGTVVRGPLQITVDDDGRTRVKDRYVVSAPLAGTLERIELHAGDRVEAGTTMLAAIEPTAPSLLDARARSEAEARVRAAEAGRKRAEANVEGARARRDLAATELRRAKQLFESGSISRSELDAAIERERSTAEDLHSSEFGVDVARFELDLARAALSHSRPGGSPDSARLEIRSPITGRVLRVVQESSTIVSTGAPLVEIGDTTKLEVEVDVLSTEAVRIARGAKAWLDHWGGDRPLRGVVRVVEPGAFTKVSALGVEEQRVNVIIDFADATDERLASLGDGYRVDARIVVAEAEDVLKVPAAALFRHADGWAVFRIANGRARLQPVTVGPSNDTEAEVREGLAKDDHVVLYPSDRIEDGTRIAAR